MNIFIIILQTLVTSIVGFYFFGMIRNQKANKSYLQKESKKELEKLARLNRIRLAEPLSAKSRPSTIDEIIGQEEGVKALKAVLCGVNPQHVLIYGPPGIGKTAAARVVLEYAKKLQNAAFKSNAPFVEVDATTLRYDERSIADPLIGSVHDPIYQGAGAYGPAGIPQPKPGAVTKAHGGILFIDEIGELQSLQMNKLLKVLEDRKVFLESAYYSSENDTIPAHIHEMFKKGLPADFRLVGATTRSPDEIPPAIRSRCVEVFFKPLEKDEIIKIAMGAAEKSNMKITEGTADLISQYTMNGRDAVNIVQIAAGLAAQENRNEIAKGDVEWVIEFGRYSPCTQKKVRKGKKIGIVNGLAVFGHEMGCVMEIEAVATAKKHTEAKVTITGIVEEEIITNSRMSKVKRVSLVKNSVTNVLNVLRNILGQKVDDFDIHINFPGGMPVDGPSAGTAMLAAVYSAINKKPVSQSLVFTGEVSVTGSVLPVGKVFTKLKAAQKAGALKAMIPKDTWQENFKDIKLEIICAENVGEIIKTCFETTKPESPISINNTNLDYEIKSADGVE